MRFLLYIDQGSGSIIFQAVLSGFLTVLIFFKRVMAYLKSLFKNKQNEEPKDKP